MEKSMNELIEKLHEEGCSCVVSNKEVRTYTHRGVDDLYRLLTQEPTFLDGAEVADRVVGKAAAAMMVKDAEAAEKLLPTALSLLHEPEKIASLEKNSAALGLPDAGQTIAKEAYKLLENK